MWNPRADGSLPGIRNRRRARSGRSSSLDAALGQQQASGRGVLRRVNTGVFHWAIIATAVWALQAVVISLDPGDPRQDRYRTQPRPDDQ